VMHHQVDRKQLGITSFEMFEAGCPADYL